MRPDDSALVEDPAVHRGLSPLERAEQFAHGAALDRMLRAAAGQVFRGPRSLTSAI
ncbi:MAG: hypothetical protein H0V22_07095 [Solirubrobacterales bacterium]|nr:hypothetical protein [Solirubrobacterales bacterium]